jgi:hypothetical protein
VNVIEGRYTATMTEADVKLSAYHECLMLVEDEARRYGPLPQTLARVIAARIQSLIEQVAESQAA